MTTELIVFVGLPGAGKSTFFRAHFAATHLHASKDLWPNARRPEARLQRVVEEALASGRSVVVDNVSPSSESRAGVIAIGRRLNVEIVGYFFDVDIATTLERNAGREGKARVPEVAIYSAAKMLDRPLLEEGFGRLFIVRDGKVREYRR